MQTFSSLQSTLAEMEEMMEEGNGPGSEIETMSELLPSLVRDVEAEEIAKMKTQPLFAAERRVEIEAIVAGHICLDILPTLVGDALAFVPGRVIEVDKAIFATGGAVSNTGLALHTLGINTRLMGKVGNDLFGQAIFQILEEHGPELVGGMVVATGEATSYSVILSPPGVDRIILHAPGCNNTFSAADVRYPILEQARLFHFGYPPLMARMCRDDGAELVQLFQRAKLHGVTTSLDLSLPDPASAAGRADWAAILTATLPFVDVFLPSIEELLFMLRRPLFEQWHTENQGALVEHVTPALLSEVGKQLLAMGAKVVGIKLGPRGLYLCTTDEYSLMEMGRAQPVHIEVWAGRELWSPCFAASVVGTTGSGDATIAGLLLGLLRSMTPEATLTAACAVGACSVEAADAVSGIQSWPATMTRIAAGWKRLRNTFPTGMSAEGWSWNKVDELWVGPGDQVGA